MRRSAPTPQAITDLKTRNAAGEMVPLGALMTGRADLRADARDALQRLSRRPTSTARPSPASQSGQAEGEIEKLLKKTLPRGMGYEWTELTYQDRLTRDVTLPGTTSRCRRWPRCCCSSVVLVILVLAAQYESWSLPLAIILIVPMCIFSALFGVWLSQIPPFMQPGDLNIFTQIALVVLVGLACKNAILIVEFAKELEERGRSRSSRR